MTESGDHRSYSAEGSSNKRRRPKKANRNGLHSSGTRSEQIDLDNLEGAVQREENGKTMMETISID